MSKGKSEGRQQIHSMGQVIFNILMFTFVFTINAFEIFVCVTVYKLQLKLKLKK